jgi:hypothetical protein
MNRTLLLSVVVLVGCAAGSAEPAALTDTGGAADSDRLDVGAAGDAGADGVVDSGTISDADAPGADADSCAPGGGAPVLSCFTGCARELFDGSPFAEEFDDATAYASTWTPSYVAPTVAGGALTFGPHPMSSNWWENYSPTLTNATFGDGLSCVRFRMTPSTVVDPAGADSLEIITRLPETGASHETSGMVLNVRGPESDARLLTRLSATEWAYHATEKLTFVGADEQIVEALLYGKGNRFVAEIKIGSKVVTLRTTYAVAATGRFGLLGWRNRKATYVDRAIVGAPTAAVAARLDAKLP